MQQPISSTAVVSDDSPFSGKIYCGDCGAQFGSKVWHSTDKYRRVIWQCNGKYKGETKCETPHIYEDELKRLFLKAVSNLLSNRKTLLEDCEMMRDTLSDMTEINKEIQKCSDEMDTVEMLTKRLITENAKTVMSQDEYNEKYDELSKRFNRAKSGMTN